MARQLGVSEPQVWLCDRAVGAEVRWAGEQVDIYVERALARRLDARQMRAVCAHELAHVALAGQVAAERRRRRRLTVAVLATALAGVTVTAVAALALAAVLAGAQPIAARARRAEELRADQIAARAAGAHELAGALRCLRPARSSRAWSLHPCPLQRIDVLERSTRRT